LSLAEAAEEVNKVLRGLLGLLGWLGSNTRNSTNSINSITLMFTTEAQRSQRKADWFYPIEREPDWIKGASLRLSSLTYFLSQVPISSRSVKP